MSDSYRMHQRLVNWGLWSQWQGPRALARPAETHAVHETDAEALEPVMLALRHERPPLYRCIWAYYVLRMHEHTTGTQMLADYCRRRLRRDWRVADGMTDTQRADRWLDLGTEWLIERCRDVA